MPSNEHMTMMKFGLGPWKEEAPRSPLLTDLRMGPLPGQRVPPNLPKTPQKKRGFLRRLWRRRPPRPEASGQ